MGGSWLSPPPCLLVSFMSKFVSRAGHQIDQLQAQLSRRETNEERGTVYLTTWPATGCD